MATIQGIYIALFGRPADPAGLAFFNEATNNGADLTAIGDLAATAEYQDRFTGLSNAEIINSIYQSLFGRDGEQSGIDFFLAALEDGTYNINNIAIAILDGAQGDDLATINAKIAAAELLTERLDQQIEVDAYVGSDAAEIARNYISNVNKDDPGTESEADAAIAQMLDLQGAGGPGAGDDTGGNPAVREIEATGSVAISDAKEGAPITISYPQPITDANGPVTLSWQWQKQIALGVWEDVPNATGDSYNVADGAAEVGNMIRVLVTSTDDSGYTTVFASAGKVIAEDNAAAVFTSAASTSVAENNASWTFDLTATDVDGDDSAITFNLKTDASGKFSLSDDGELSLTSAFDYETMGSNKYVDLVVEATDDRGAVSEQTIRVSVTDVAERTVYKFTTNEDGGADLARISNWKSGDLIEINWEFGAVANLQFDENTSLYTGRGAESDAYTSAAYRLIGDHVGVAYYRDGNQINAIVAVRHDVDDNDADLFIKVENVGTSGALGVGDFAFI